MSIWTIVLASGAATRFGGLKQFATLGGRRLVDHVVRTASSASDGVVVVLPPGYEWDGPLTAAAVVGSATRSGSVRQGLRAVPASAQIIVVHDAAHPLATPTLFGSVIREVRGGVDAAVPAVPLTEAIKRVRANRVMETLPRDQLMLVQTPQAFRAEVLRSAHSGDPDEIEDSALVERIGGTVAVVPGDPRNLHVTTPLDVELAAVLLELA